MHTNCRFTNWTCGQKVNLDTLFLVYGGWRNCCGTGLDSEKCSISGSDFYWCITQNPHTHYANPAAFMVTEDYCQGDICQ